jgi:molecular chaperone DnaK (HSP70)
MSKNICIGIDLGTTYSCVAYWNNDHAEIIPNLYGKNTTESFVSLSNDNQRIVGSLAKNNAIINPKNTFYDIKRLLGKKYTELFIANELNNYSFDILRDKDDKIIINTTSNCQYFPEEISAMVLSEMKNIAEKHLGQKIIDAVITVPAYFNDGQRNSTKTAAIIAGLNPIRIINEPTAACLYYGIHQKINSGRILVFDLGGGTLDVSLLELNNGLFEVLATSGNTRLGGEDFDQKLIEYFMKEFKKITDIDLKIINNGKTLHKLKRAAEECKNNLSYANIYQSTIDSLYNGIDFSFEITRHIFENICSDIFDLCLDPIKKVLLDTHLLKKDINEIVFVGGATRMPKITEIIQDYFNNNIKINKSINPDEAVALGASIQGTILSGTDISGKTNNMILIDVLPLSLGVETNGGIMITMINRNSSIPCEKTLVFSTIEDYQTVVKIIIYEGERRFVSDNHLLGSFNLEGIESMPKGIPKIYVSFNVDENGILTVSAKNKLIENFIEIKNNITNDLKLSDTTISKMIDDAKKYKLDDEYKKNSIESCINFTNYIQTTQISINNDDSRISTDQVSSINKLLIDALEWLYTDKDNYRTSEDIEFYKMNLENTIKQYMNCHLYKDNDIINNEDLHDLLIHLF